MPDTQRVQTPPGSVITIRVPDDGGPEQTFALATELHRQTGLPVVVLNGSAELSVTTRQEAEEALGRRITYRTGDDAALLSAFLLSDLAEDGWELIRLRQP